MQPLNPTLNNVPFYTHFLPHRCVCLLVLDGSVHCCSTAPLQKSCQLSQDGPSNAGEGGEGGGKFQYDTATAVAPCWLVQQQWYIGLTSGSFIEVECCVT